MELIVKQVIRSLKSYVDDLNQQENFEEECEEDNLQADDLCSWNEMDGVEQEEEDGGVLYDSPFEETNAVQWLKRCLETIETQQPQRFQQILGLLSQQEQISLQKHIQFVVEKQTEE